MRTGQGWKMRMWGRGDIMEVEAKQGLETEQMLENGSVLRDKAKEKGRVLQEGLRLQETSEVRKGQGNEP